MVPAQSKVTSLTTTVYRYKTTSQFTDYIQISNSPNSISFSLSDPAYVWPLAVMSRGHQSSSGRHAPHSSLFRNLNSLKVYRRTLNLGLHCFLLPGLLLWVLNRIATTMMPCHPVLTGHVNLDHLVELVSANLELYYPPISYFLISLGMNQRFSPRTSYHNDSCQMAIISIIPSTFTN